MEESEIKHVLEAALLATDKPVQLDKLVELFRKKAPDVDKDIVKTSLSSLESDYADRGLELTEVASGFRIQVRSRMAGWLQPLWDERAPRYSRALLETLALIAYRQPITRGEIEEIRGVAVNPNIVRTMLERKWIRVVGHRDVPGKPEMFGTSKEFLDYFGLKSLDQLPVLADLDESGPVENPQADLVEGLGEGKPAADELVGDELADADVVADADIENEHLDEEIVDDESTLDSASITTEDAVNGAS